MHNHSLMTADRATHLKIAAVTLLAVVVVVAVGARARAPDAGTDTARVETHGPVVKAGKPATFTSRDDASVR
jgi:cytochrome oxidase Cu insertion factor (SCO1/SenC/PrrC family)